MKNNCKPRAGSPRVADKRQFLLQQKNCLHRIGTRDLEEILDRTYTVRIFNHPEFKQVWKWRWIFHLLSFKNSIFFQHLPASASNAVCLRNKAWEPGAVAENEASEVLFCWTQ